MASQFAKSITVLGVFAAVAATGFGLFLQNASGDFKSVLQLGSTGAKLVGLLFVPISIGFFVKAFRS